MTRAVCEFYAATKFVNSCYLRQWRLPCVMWPTVYTYKRFDMPCLKLWHHHRSSNILSALRLLRSINFRVFCVIYGMLNLFVSTGCHCQMILLLLSFWSTTLHNLSSCTVVNIWNLFNTSIWVAAFFNLFSYALFRFSFSRLYPASSGQSHSQLLVKLSWWCTFWIFFPSSWSSWLPEVSKPHTIARVSVCRRFENGQWVSK